MTSTIGAQRRLRALIAIGYPLQFLAAELGIADDRALLTWVCGNANVRKPRAIRATSNEDVRMLFDRLHMTVGPSDEARAVAKSHNWALPLQWDDDTVDNPRSKPLPVLWNTRSRARERREQVGQLTARGHTSREIADILGVTTRTVVRHRRHNRTHNETNAADNSGGTSIEELIDMAHTAPRSAARSAEMPAAEHHSPPPARSPDNSAEVEL